jgi:hypothetical protein
MWPSHRLLFLLTTIIVFSLPALMIDLAWAQTAVPQTGESHASGLPARWDEALQALVEKIALMAGPARKVSIEMKNISSLSVAEANAMQQELLRELKQRHLQPSLATQGEVSVHMTLSQGVEGYIWSAEIRKGEVSQIFLAGVPRQLSNTDGRPNGLLTLDARLLWAQPEKFIDFALAKPSNSDSTLNILGLNQIESYKFSDSVWHPERAIPISRTTPVRRDGAGGFDIARWDTFWFDVDCIGPPGEPKNMSCSMWYSVTPTNETHIKVRGREESVGAILKGKCGDNSILIASGSGDWTQPDILQGYLFAGLAEEAVPSGSPIPFDGPVLNLRPDWKENTVRMVAHNLKTGNYEGYLVTATCSQ